MSNSVNMLNLLETGIRAESMRQKAIADNVANLNTPGFKRGDVRFEELLNKAMSSGGTVNLDEIQPEIFKPMTTRVNGNGNDVSLDHEVGKMVKNSLKHKTLTLILKKKYMQMEAAMRVM